MIMKSFTLLLTCKYKNNALNKNNTNHWLDTKIFYYGNVNTAEQFFV